MRRLEDWYGLDRDIPYQGEVWVHFKGKYYEIICLARNCNNIQHEDDDPGAVVYKSLEDGSIYYRSIKEFMSEVDHERYPNAPQKYRFVKFEVWGDEDGESSSC